MNTKWQCVAIIIKTIEYLVQEATEGEGELEEDSQKVQTSSYKINKY